MEKKSKKKIVTSDDKNKISGRKAIIPEIGSKLLLEQDWEFSVFSEHRNADIIKADGNKVPSYNVTNKSYLRTLPAGTEFFVDRIYIRNGMKDFSSVTLRIAKTTDEKILASGTKRIPFKKATSSEKNSYGRFWVKLVDFNKANMTIIDDKVLIGKMKTIRGEACTFADIKNKSKKRSETYWVKFVDEKNKEYCFDGIAWSSKTNTKYRWNFSGVSPEDKKHYSYWNEEQKILHDHKPYIKGATFTEVYPKNFFEWPLIAGNWLKKNSNQSLGGRKKFPYQDLLCLTRDEEKLKEMGIVDKTTPIENIKLGDGLFLSIYKLAEIEVMVEEGEEENEEE